MFLFEVLKQPQIFFTHLKSQSFQWAMPSLLLFVFFVLSSFIPLLLGVLNQQDLLASLIFNSVGLLIFMLCAWGLSGTIRILELIGFSLIPVLLVMLFMVGLWFLGDLARGLGSLFMLLALFFSSRAVLIGVSIMTQNSAIAWRTVLLAPLLTFLFMAVPFGLLMRVLGLA
jgi:hypothetical protein